MKTTLTLMNSVFTLNSGARKTIRAKYLGLLLGLLTLSFFVQAQTPQVITTLGSVSGCPGQDVLVPVNVSGFTNITGVSLTIRYDTSQLTGVSIQNLNPAVNNNFLSFFSITGDSGYLAIAAYTVSGSMSIPDGGLMLNIKFNVKNKPLYAGITFDLDHYGVCEYADNTPGTPMPIPSTPSDWVNGSVYTQPSFSFQPSNVLITPGANGYFFVNTMGNNSFLWQVSTTTPNVWSNLSTGGVYGDVTNDTLFINNATIGMNGYKYRAVASSVTGGCPSPYNIAYSNAVTLTVSAPCPTIYNVTGGGNYCPGTGGVHIFLSGSETGVNYQLKLNGTNTGTPVAGTGSLLDLGMVTAVGSYTVAGINSNACSPQLMSGSVNVGTYNITAANVTTNSPPGGVCGNSTAAVTFNLNGFKPFIFTYSNGTTNQTLSVITHNDTTIFVTPAVTTTYTIVSATDGHGCAMNIIGNPATVVVKASPIAVASSNSPVCSGSTINLSSAGSSGAITLSWTFGTTSLTGANPSITNATTANSGVYTLLATAPNACTATATTTVVVNTVPSAAGAISGPATVCELTTQTYSVGTISGATSYIWSVPAGASITSGNGTSTIQVTYSASAVNGNITVMGQSNCGDGATSTLAVSVSDAPTATASNNGPLCAGATLNLSAGGGTIYNWSGPASFASTFQNPSRTDATIAMSGTYTVTVTGSTGCVNTASTIVTVNANPVATIGASPNPVCSGSLLSLTAGGGTAYLWAGPGGYSSTTQNPAFLANLGSQGTYTVTVTNTSTNCKATNSVAVTVNTAPTATANNNNPCEGSTLILSSGGGTSYSWSGPAGFSSNLQNPSIGSVTSAAAGTYTVLVTSANGCSKAATTVVAIKPQPSPISASSNTPVCEGGSINLLSSGGVSYAWSGPNAFLASQQNPDPIMNASAANAGSYTVIVTGSNGCSASTSTAVVVNANPVANAGTDQLIQQNQSTTLGGTATGGSGSYFWNWQPAASLVNNTVQNPTTVALSANTAFTLVVTDAVTGCVSTQSAVNVNVSASLPLLASIAVTPFPTFCAGTNLSFTANAIGGTGTYSYTWSGPDGFSSSLQNPQITSASGAAAGTYNLTVSDGVDSFVATPVSLNVAYASQSYNVGTSGSYCFGTSGLPISLSGSDLSVNYQLYKNGIALGSPLAGTGLALNFGNQTAGSYTVIGSNLCGNVTMAGSAVIDQTPFPLAFNVSGGGSICVEYSTTITLSGTESGVAYDVYLNGFATSYGFTGDGNAYTFSVNAAGTYTITATNNCATVNMNNSAIVTELFFPMSFNVSGGSSFCQFTSGLVTLSGSEAGVTYELYKDGAATGSSFIGNGLAIEFTVTATGVYTILGSNSCGSTPMTGDATFILVDSPAVFAVTGGSPGAVCALQSFPIGLSGSESGVTYTLYLNSLATPYSIIGNGNAFDFGNFTDAGTYAVVATNNTNCVSNMANQVYIIYSTNPSITTEPVNAVVDAGNNTGFAVTALNATSYAWYESNNGGSSWTLLADGGIYSGTATSALGLTGVPFSMNNYLYKSIVSNGDCQVSSLSASLTVNQVVSTTTISLSQMSFCPGVVVIPVYVQNFNGIAATSLVFDFNASVLTYTGYQNVNAGLNNPSNLVVNQTGGSLSISHYVTNTASEIGNGTLLELVFQYSGGNTGLIWDITTAGNCELADINTNILNSAYVNGSITQVGVTPVITAQPMDASVYSGFNANFHVSVAGASSYQWQTYNGGWVNLSNNAPYSGVNTADLMITGTSLGMNGNLYRVIVSESACNLSATSNQALLTVTESTISFITTAGTVTSCIGPMASAPVSVAGMPNVAAISLTLNYNPAVITNVGYTNLNSLMTGGNINVNNTPGEWKFSWYQITPISILSGNLFDLTFDYLGGSTDLSWDLVTPGNCEYNDFDGNIIPAIFVNGHVGPSAFQAAITSNPVDQSIFDGGNASFSISATNAVTYQWQVSTDGIVWSDLSNTGVYSGANSATLNLTAATLSMNGNRYRSVVNGNTCPEISEYATLIVNYVVQNIITTAGTVSGCTGSAVVVPVSVQYAYNVAAISLTLQYNASALSFVSYDNLNAQLVGGSINTFDLPGEWRFSWYSIAPVNIGSGNLFDLTFNYLGGASNLVWDLATSGNCEYNDFDGNILPATYVNGLVSPGATQALITAQPANITVIDGDNASFTVAATNANTYQWQISTNGSTWSNLTDGGTYSGVNTATLNITPAVITMNGFSYRVIVNATDCPAVSMAANLNVTPFGGTIITTAGSVNGCTGMEAIIPVDVQYLYNCAAISLTLNYDPSVISYISYSNLNPQISTANLNIFDIPGEWKFSWYSLTPVNIGSDKLFDLNFDYLGGSTDLVWNLSVPGFCEYDDFGGNILPAIYVNGHVGPSANEPVVTSQPADITVNHGDVTTFHVIANNATNYQWQISNNGGSSWSNLSNNAYYSGVNTADLTVTNAIYFFNGNQYRVVVSNALCAAYSSAATLTVLPELPWTITTYAPVINACPGSDIVVPITVTDFYNIAANSLTLHYNNTALTYNGYQNLNPAMADALISPTPGEFKFSWYSLTPLSLGDATLVELLFHYNGGSTDLTWDLTIPGNCEYNDFNGNVLPSAYVNGSVGSSALTPVISTQPANVTSFVGAPPAYFTVNAVNATAYQWQVSNDGGASWSNLANVAPYAGVNTNTLEVSPLSIDLNGLQYRVILDGTCSLSATSDAATLTVYNLIITTAGNVTGCANNNVFVPITVEHVYNVGAVSLTLNYDASQLTFIGYTNLHPSVDPATLLVNASNGQVKISYTSLSPLNFGDGQLLSLEFSALASNTILSWDNVTPGNNEWVDFTTFTVFNGQYNDGSVVVYDLATITSDPTSVSLDETGNATFTVVAANAASYQWQVSANGGISWTDLVNNAFYAGVNTNTLVLSGITLDMNTYQYRAIAIAYGNCEPYGVSAAATLTVTPIIKTIAGDVVTCANNSIIVPVSVEHLYGVGAISLTLNYNAADLTYVGYQDANSLLDPAVLTINAVGGQVKIGYFTSTPLDLGNALMLNLVFSSNGGYSNLIWDVVTPSNCEYVNTSGGLITSIYVDGSVQVNPLPVITFNNYGPYCIDAAPVTLEALPVGGFFSGAGVVGNVFDPAAAGAGTWPVTYTFTDGLGCTNSATVYIVVNPLPVVSIVTAGPFCINETYTLAGNPAGGTFSGPGIVNNVFDPSVSGLGTFTFTYTYTDANGCTNSTSATVVVNDIPVVTIGSLGVYCNNEAPVQLTGTPAGGVFSGPGVVGDMFYPNLAGTGTWTVTYTFTDGNACANFATTTVLVNQVPTAFPVFGGGEYCSGGLGHNVGTGGSEAGFEYHLYLNGINTGQMLIGTGSILNFGLQTLAGTYTIYAINPGTGCENWLSGSVNVIINPLPVVYGGGYTIICQGSGATLNAQVSGGTAPYLYSWTPATGLSSANVLNPVASPQTTTFYQIVVTDSKGCTSTDNALIVVNAAPLVSAGPDVTINVGMITPLSATVSGGHAPYTYQWTPATGLNNANVLAPLASPTVTTTYTLVVTDNLGCTGTDQVTVTVTSVPLGYNITGFVTYDNLLNSPMKNTNVLLKQSNVTVNTAVTDLAGSYGFSLIPNGSYTLTGQTNKTWGGGNSVDALLMARHFVGLQPLTGLRLLAGDLNADGIINAADALLVMRRSVVMINSFVVGDWIFETKNAIVNNGNLAIDFKALCYGDVNGSNVNIPALKVSPSVTIETRGTQIITGAGNFELPIRAGHNLAVGAASLAISFNADAVEILGVEVAGDGRTSNLVYQVQDGVLYLEWYNLNGLELNSDENLFTLKMGVKDINALSNLQFAVSAESQMGDPYANVLNQTTLTSPKLQLAGGLFALSANYPNPFNQSTTIAYTIPENGKVTLSIYNLIGEKIAEVVNAAQDAGSYTVTLDGTTLQQGVYTYRLVVNGKSANYEQTKRMIVTR